MATGGAWRSAYLGLISELPSLAACARITICGMSACVDARIALSDLAPLLQSRLPEAAANFLVMLKERAARGIGGEVRVDWPGGPAWLSERFKPRYALGGTGPQAAWVLSTIGAPAILALRDRSAHMLSQLPPDVLLAEGGGTVPARQAALRGEKRPDIFIFEYTAGVPVDEVVPPRSSRIIVRFSDPGLEQDGDFDALTPMMARSAGAGLVSGFNCEPAGSLDAAIERVFALCRAWRSAGLETIHLELAGYDSPAARDRVLDAAAGVVTSIGMSQSELLALDPESDPPHRAMTALGDRLGLDRVCVHADHWAAAVTRGDPKRERLALMAGCLLAASRAAAGMPVLPNALDPEARFHELPFAAEAWSEAWSFVACPSPHLGSPATTLGLGDSFTAGCLLVLGQARPESEDPADRPAIPSTAAMGPSAP
jgi:ADP-dependent phosphofructokinase/glucokinase